MAQMKGKGASPGTAFGSAFIFQQQKFRFSELKSFDPAREKSRWEDAHKRVLHDLASLKDKFQSSGPKESLQILEAHHAMAEDPEWISQIEAKMTEGYQCEFAVKVASDAFAEMIEALDDPYLRQRAQDIRDVAKRIHQALAYQGSAQVSGGGDFVLFAEDLLPSELLSFYQPQLKGIVLEFGNATSHTTILARTFEIPLILKVSGVLETVRPGDEVVVDGLKGLLVVSPDGKEKEHYRRQIEQEKRDQQELAKYVKLPTKTQDGLVVEVASNLNSELDVDFALRKGSEGVGLFRTEFLLMDRRESPHEDEQFQIYKKVLEAFAPHRVVIRTFDIGGDKQVDYLKLPVEANPFLGCRGIRFCLKELAFFKTQLRALLRASDYGRLGIMVPMVSRLDELLAFKNLVQECAQELRSRGQEVKTMPELGIMIEVPSVALIADQLAPHLDFMSVGTNDLVQYLCAADRMNSTVADLHDSYHPALLRTLKIISDSVAGKKLWMGMCGELAAQEDYIPLLLALGFKELSVSPGTVLRTRRRVISCDLTKSRHLLEKALKMASSTELKAALNTP